jgi:hypothetical protein
MDWSDGAGEFGSRCGSLGMVGGTYSVMSGIHMLVVLLDRVENEESLGAGRGVRGSSTIACAGIWPWPLAHRPIQIMKFSWGMFGCLGPISVSLRK